MENNSMWLVWVVIIGIFLFATNSNSQSEKVRELRAVIESQKMLIEGCSNTIDEANNNIEEAKWYAWEDYYAMGDALDYMETVDNNCYID